ncbi:Delta(6)-protoilludene synthase, partial [Trametes pubescens]
PAYALAALSLDIPPEISELPLLEDLRRSITEIMILDNDLLSYRKEYAAGEVMHNILTLVMHEKHLDLDAAVAWVVAEHAKRVDRALALWREVPSLMFDSADTEKAVAVYLDHLIHWPRVNECFTFESGRYFRKDGPRVKWERVVELVSPEEMKHAIAASPL